eukprot:g15604.t1
MQPPRKRAYLECRNANACHEIKAKLRRAEWTILPAPSDTDYVHFLDECDPNSIRNLTQRLAKIPAEKKQSIWITSTVVLDGSYGSQLSGMGGTFHRDMPLEVTHLVTKDFRSTKYQTALENGIAVVSESWVRQSFIRGRLLSPTDFPPPLLMGQRICISGQDLASRDKAKALVTSYGGTYCKDLESDVNILLVTKAAGTKYEYAKNWTIKVLRFEWLQAYTDSKGTLDEERFLIEPHSEEQASESHRAFVENSTERVDPVAHESNVRFASKTAARQNIEARAAEGIDDSYLDPCVVVLLGWNASLMQQCIEMVLDGGGTVLRDYNPLVTHIVAPSHETARAAAKELGFPAPTAPVLNYEWLVRCSLEHRLVPPSAFVLDYGRVVSAETMSEEASVKKEASVKDVPPVDRTSYQNAGAAAFAAPGGLYVDPGSAAADATGVLSSLYVDPGSAAGDVTGVLSSLLPELGSADLEPVAKSEGASSLSALLTAGLPSRPSRYPSRMLASSRERADHTSNPQPGPERTEGGLDFSHLYQQLEQEKLSSTDVSLLQSTEKEATTCPVEGVLNSESEQYQEHTAQARFSTATNPFVSAKTPAGTSLASCSTSTNHCTSTTTTTTSSTTTVASSDFPFPRDASTTPTTTEMQASIDNDDSNRNGNANIINHDENNLSHRNNVNTASSTSKDGSIPFNPFAKNNGPHDAIKKDGDMIKNLNGGYDSNGASASVNSMLSSCRVDGSAAPQATKKENVHVALSKNFSLRERTYCRQVLNQLGATCVSIEAGELSSAHFLVSLVEIAQEELEEWMRVAPPSMEKQAWTLQQVSPYWLERCTDAKRFIDPSKNLLFRPLPCDFTVYKNLLDGASLEGFRSFLMSSTNFNTKKDRAEVERLVKLAGAQHTEHFRGKSHTHLISNAASGAKYESAIKNHVPVVKLDWLWSCFRAGKAVDIEPFGLGEQVPLSSKTKTPKQRGVKGSFSTERDTSATNTSFSEKTPLATRPTKRRVDAEAVPDRNSVVKYTCHVSKGSDNGAENPCQEERGSRHLTNISLSSPAVNTSSLPSCTMPAISAVQLTDTPSRARTTPMPQLHESVKPEEGMSSEDFEKTSVQSPRRKRQLPEDQAESALHGTSKQVKRMALDPPGSSSSSARENGAQVENIAAALAGLVPRRHRVSRRKTVEEPKQDAKPADEKSQQSLSSTTSHFSLQPSDLRSDASLYHLRQGSGVSRERMLQQDAKMYKVHSNRHQWGMSPYGRNRVAPCAPEEPLLEMSQLSQDSCMVEHEQEDVDKRRRLILERAQQQLARQQAAGSAKSSH